VSLVTRCPVCGTAFRVQREQLAARGGKVRCGKCGGVFDGVSGLVVQGTAPLVLEPSPQLGLFDPSRRAAESAAAPAGALPEFLAEDEPRRLPLAWALASLAAAAALAAQAAIHYRTEVATLVPEARRPLEAACERLGCSLRLPRRPELMSIDSSDLQADPRREGVIVLNAVIRNRAAFAQEYPALELTLTDEADRAVLRRVLAPADYLELGRAPSFVARGIAAGAEAQLRLHLDASGARATGYRLYLFYP
jgi:predicted Zn finger-like uncharacterized protein